MSPTVPAGLVAYRLTATAMSPLAPLWLRRRVAAGKEDPGRIGERLGHAGRRRPEGDLVWAHGASIGETQALLPLVESLTGRGLKVLVTSGTRTSAEILARRLPAGARHQFAPLDLPAAVRRFLDHWRPSLALLSESEIWPNTVVEVARRGVPLVLVNGRMSARSAAGWRRAPAVARALLGRFAACLAQSAGDAERLAELGAARAAVSGNLKLDLPPLTADPALVEDWAARLAGRPVWLAASTHPGEEEVVVEAHHALRGRWPGLLTIVAPRHPARGQEIAAEAAATGLATGRRSRDEPPDGGAELYVADTVGELGLLYRVAPLAFVGGSLVPRGGQNPIEPVRLGAAVLHGPEVGNFAEIYAALDAADAARTVRDAASLAGAVDALLREPGRMRDMARRGRTAVDAFGGALARTLDALEPYLPPPRDPAGSVW